MNNNGFEDKAEEEAREIVKKKEACSMLDKAQAICTERHAGQVDKAGEPYYLHPFAVAEAVDGEYAKTVAYLHDIVEDTDATFEWLASQGFPVEVVEAVDAITRREGETYGDYIARVGRNRLARAVKIADLKHNLDPSRRGATEAMRGRYSEALAELEGIESGS